MTELAWRAKFREHYGRSYNPANSHDRALHPNVSSPSRVWRKRVIHRFVEANPSLLSWLYEVWPYPPIPDDFEFPPRTDGVAA